MPRSRAKPLAEFPTVFFSVVEKSKKEPCQQLPMPDRGTAHATAHLFNRFRQAMVRENHPDSEQAIDIVCRVTNLAPINSGLKGTYIIEFVPRGLAQLADQFKGKDVGVPEGKDRLPDFSPSPVPDTAMDMVRKLVPEPEVGPDRTEQLIEQYTGVRGPRDDCKHEEDATGTFCLLCNKPKINW